MYAVKVPIDRSMGERAVTRSFIVNKREFEVSDLCLQ
jgi:hypothetical protein